MAALTLENAGRTYGAIEALHPVSLTVEEGETVALLGPSGSGKTTLLSMIAGEIAPTSGTIRVGDLDLRSLRQGPQLASAVGMLHQQFDLVPHLSTLQNVLAGRLGQWSFGRSLVSLMWPRDRAIADAALTRVGVLDRASIRAAKLSGGEQQRVAIARLLLQDPRLVLADEPVSSLDPARAEEIVRLLVATTQESGKTLIASIHLVDLARKHFGRLVGLRNGRVYFDAPADEVTDDMLARLYDLGELRAEV
jgi:phosphonate transport system ATP-binding protein